MIIGTAIAYITYQYREVRRRCLADGNLVKGTVSGIAQSNVVVNNQPRQIATLEYSVDGRTLQSTVNVHGQQTKLASSLKDSGDPVNVLVNPEDPTRIVCTDFLVLLSK